MINYESQSMMDRAAEIGLDAVTEYLEEEGVRVEHVVVLVHATDLPDDERTDMATAAVGERVNGGMDILSILSGHLSAAARSFGMSVSVIPVRRAPNNPQDS